MEEEKTNISEEEKVVGETEPKDEVVEPTPDQKEEKKPSFFIPLPESEKPKERRLAPNSKPFFLMRLIEGLIDACILLLAIVGLNQLFMLTPIGGAINNYVHEMYLIEDDYKLKTLVEGSVETYGHKLYDNEEDYDKYTSAYIVYDADETGHKYVIINNEEISSEVVSAYKKAINADKTYKNLNFDYLLVSYGMTMLSGFIAEGIFLLAIPLLNKRRMTIGKWAAGHQLIDVKLATPPRWYQMVGRFAFQFVVESAIPFLFINNMILHFLIAPTFLFTFVLFNKNGRTLHDLVSRTMVIDKRTYLPITEQ